MFSLLVVGLFTLSLSFPLAGQSSLPALASYTKIAYRSIRINNFGRIDAGYYRGAAPQGSDYRDLAALGVKTVIDLTSDDSRKDEQEMVEHAGMTYIHIPMTTHTPPTAEQVRTFLSLAEDAAKEPVFVHCVGGKHRTGVMTAVYRMTEDGWNSDQAFKEMKHYKFGMDFLHPEFKKFVYSYRPDRPHPDVATVGSGASANKTR